MCLIAKFFFSVTIELIVRFTIHIIIASLKTWSSIYRGFIYTYVNFTKEKDMILYQ